MHILPAIDLKHGKCVRLRQGAKDSATVYGDDPRAMALRWRDEGATILHLVNLDGAFDDADAENLRAAEQIVTALDIPVQFGGGVRTAAQAATLFDLGMARVILGTVAVEKPELVGELVARYGAARIVVGIDARDGNVLTHGWETDTAQPVIETARAMAALGVERIIYTDVSRDGMLIGVNVESTAELARESGLKIIASGGIGSLDDIRALRAVADAGIEGCIVGKALYEARFTLGEAMAV